MRMERFGAMGAAALLCLAACGGEEEVEAEVVPELAAGSQPSAIVIDPVAAAAGIEAAHGGTVVTVGDQFVEVLASDDGTVDAYVLTPQPPAPDQTRVTVRLPADDGDTHPVMLTWDPAGGRYRGRLRQVHPVPGPVEVVIVVGGAAQRGTAPQIVLFGPSGPIGGPRMAVRNAGSQGPDVIEVEGPPQPQVVMVEPPRPGVVVVERPAPPPGPTVVVTHPMPPRPTVVVNAPSPPRPTVVVNAPSPPRPTVVVHAPAPPRPTVVVRQPAPRVVVQRPGARVEVRRGGPAVRVHSDNGLHRGHGRGHGGGHGGGHGRRH
jgi:hypothetical protein